MTSPGTPGNPVSESKADMNDRLEKRFQDARNRVIEEFANLGITPRFIDGMTQEQIVRCLAAVIKAGRVAHHPDHGGSVEKMKWFSRIPNPTRDKPAFSNFVKRLIEESAGLRAEYRKKGFEKSGKPIQDALARVGISHTFVYGMNDENGVKWIVAAIMSLLEVHHPDKGGDAKRSIRLTRILDWIKKESVPSRFIERLKEESAGSRGKKVDPKKKIVKKLGVKNGKQVNRPSRRATKKIGE
jgi:hypothetical protein